MKLRFRGCEARGQEALTRPTLTGVAQRCTAMVRRNQRTRERATCLHKSPRWVQSPVEKAGGCATSRGPTVPILPIIFRWPNQPRLWASLARELGSESASEGVGQEVALVRRRSGVGWFWNSAISFLRR